jgi:hypothetical protein
MKQLILAAALAVATVAATGAEASACGRRVYVSYYTPHYAPYYGHTTWNGCWHYQTWPVSYHAPTVWYHHHNPCWQVGPGGVIIGSAPATGPVQSAAAVPTALPVPTGTVIVRR